MKTAWAVLWLGCMGCAARANEPSSQMPRRGPSPSTPVAAATTTSSLETSPNTANPGAPTTAALASANAATFSSAHAAPELTPHGYHRVFHGWPSLWLQSSEPYLIATEGIVNLRTRVVDFERSPANWGAYLGDSLWFADNFMPMSACPEPSTLAQRVGGKWVPRLEVNVHALTVRPWVKGSSLAAIVPFRMGPPWGYELTVLERNRTAPRPERRGAHHSTDCVTRIGWFQTLAAFPSGEIFAFGSECPTVPLPEDDPEQVPEDVAADAETLNPEHADLPPNVMESWHHGRHEFIPVPFRELSQVIGVGPKDLWATGTRDDDTWAVGHFDGAAWQILPDYYDDRIVALAVYAGESGVGARRLLLTTQHLFETNQGVTTEHELPATCRARALDLDGADFWVACYEDDEITLYTTRDDIAEFRFDTPGPQRELVTFANKAYPRLDPRAPSLRSCRSREFEAPPPMPSDKSGGKPSPHRGKAGGKPSPHRGKSSSTLNDVGVFGY